MIRAVLFDLDGTLADSLADLAAAGERMLARRNFPGHTLPEYRSFVGNGIPKLVERLLPKAHRSAEECNAALTDFLAYYGNHYADQTTAYPGMAALLDALKKCGICLAVVTNKNQEMAEKVVTKLYGNRFDLIFGKRDGIPTKPDPTGAQLVMKTLGVNPAECIFMGDSAVDMQTALQSGALPVGVLWGYRTKQELTESGARYIMETPSQFLAVLEEYQ